MIANKQLFSTKEELAAAAARRAIEILQDAIAVHGSAVWVLAGGSTPGAAYKVIAEKYLDAINWSKVTFVIGDERIVPLDSPDSNWHVVDEILLRHIPQATFVRPASDQSAEIAAAQYEVVINTLPETDTGYPRFDLVWLGVGEDGHTLSLFPSHFDDRQGNHLVIPIHNSPKPPADRITLTYKALKGTKHCMIMVAGSEKAVILKRIHAGEDLPAVIAAAIPVTTTWFLDRAAANFE